MTKKKIILSLGIFCFLIFFLLAFLIMTERIVGFDKFIYNHISPFISDSNTIIMNVVTTFGNAQFLIPVAIILVMLMRNMKKYKAYNWILLIALLSSDLISVALKSIFERARPTVLPLVTETSYSFPSSHAFVSICFYGFLIYVIARENDKKWKYTIAIILSILILGIGLSRIYLGIHYASDVIAGYSMGFAWLLFIIGALKKKEN